MNILTEALFFRQEICYYRRGNLHVFHERLTNNSEIIGSVVDARVDQSIGLFLIFDVGSTDLFTCILIDSTIAQEARRGGGKPSILIDSLTVAYSDRQRLRVNLQVQQR